MYEAPPHLPPDGMSHQELSCLQWAWLVASTLAVIFLGIRILGYDPLTRDVQPASGPFDLPPGSGLALVGLTLLLTILRARIATGTPPLPPRRAVRYGIVGAFWVLVSGLVVLLGLLNGHR